ncbi:MAG TPA: lysophospholipid acyltransferase family protein [Polyangiaceae bacterium]|nr:lysophospholipid acyltransferase family protein [Polyangiaceae bacterium]
MSSARTSARRAVRVASFLGSTSGYLSAWLLRDAVTRQDRELLRDRWTQAWCDSVLRIFGVRVVAIGEPPGHGEDHGRGRLVVSNHRGVIDVAALMRTFGGRFVSRADMAGWPLLGFGARKLGTIFVDRENKVSGAATIREMRELLAQHRTINIFPEGTTFAGDEVRPFHAGAFLSAIGVPDAEIVPAGLAYSRRSDAAFLDETFPQHLSRMAGADPSFVVVSVGRPLQRGGKKPRAADLAARARAAVAEEVARARAKADELDAPSACM